jgi:hypothetical protein
MAALFISYRRQDAPDLVGRLHDRMVVRFGPGSVFRDIDSIGLGVDFRERLRAALESCRALVAVIGPGFLRRGSVSGPDYVIEEIAGALERSLPVLPVLIHGAEMPSPDDLPERIRDLAFRQAARLRGDPDFARDADAVLRWLEMPATRGDAAAARGAGGPPALELVSGPNKGTRVEIRKARTLLGRNRQCDVLLDSKMVSQFHAEIISGPDGLSCQDLGSSNGIYLNGERVSDRAPLHDGDLLHVGDTIWQVHLGDAAVGAAASRVGPFPLRLTVHLAHFAQTPIPCCFINATNVSPADVELTHVWLATTPPTYPTTPDRPLPKRLRPQETWEVWIPLPSLPGAVREAELHRLARARLSSGVVVESVANDDVPAQGVVPGGPITRVP